MTNHSISVVIPCHNGRETISRALRSVFSQTIPPAEIIVVDDGSTDGSAHLVSTAFPNVTLIQQPQRGAAAARNAGMQRAMGEYIAFLDADDVWFPYKSEAQLPVLRSSPRVGLVCGPTIWATNSQSCTIPRTIRPGWYTRPTAAIFGNTRIRTSAVLMRRSLIELVGLMDEAMRLSQDIDYFLRIAAAGWEIAYTYTPVTIGYNLPTRNTANLHQLARAQIEVISKWDPVLNPDSPLSPAQFGRACARVCALAAEYATAAGHLEDARAYLLKGILEQRAPLQLRAACLAGWISPKIAESVTRTIRAITGRRSLHT